MRTLVAAVLMGCLFVGIGWAETSAGDAPQKTIAPDLTWEGLLEKAKAQKTEADNAAPRPARTPEDLDREWMDTLKAAGYLYSNTPEGQQNTYYPNGRIQSERFFQHGVVQELKWYSLDSVLIFHGKFKDGKLVFRRRYKPTGELESEWDAETAVKKKE